MRKALLLFYVVTFYVFAEMAWWGYLLIKAEPDRKMMVLGEGTVFLFLVITHVCIYLNSIFDWAGGHASCL